MWISRNWLERHVDLSGVDPAELGERITRTVAELEQTVRIGEGLGDVVVGAVEDVRAIEGTKLTHCRVDAGDAEPRWIVCGAPNVAAGQRVPVVPPGTTLGELTVEERAIKGHASQGMIASEHELGLGGDQAGILVLGGEPAAGTPLSELVRLEDTLFEIDNKSITHRPDLWGHRGFAREIAAILGRELTPLDRHLDRELGEGAPLDVRVEDERGCPRYTAVTLDGVTTGPSPLWLRTLLHRVGVRAIDRVVDATNFVMLDLGNPLHAFDRREVRGEAITVRTAAEDERFTTLDGGEHTLSDRDLLICDAERPVALAGVMGGANSEVRADTTQLVLESANFDPVRIRRTAQRLGLRTESSARFEKSLDPHLAEDAARAFCRLLGELDPNVRVTSGLMDAGAPLPAEPTIALRPERVRARLGVDVPDETIRSILEGIGFAVEPGEGVRMQVRVPSFRATKDIELEADLIEEVGRFWGYDHITPQPPAVVLSKPHPQKWKQLEATVRSHLTRAGGVDEVMTYSFDHDPLLDRIGARPAEAERVGVSNPISAEMPALRRDLGPNLLGVLERNAREHDVVRVFELGRIFRPPDAPGGLPVQPTTLGVLLSEGTGEADPDARLFFALKGLLQGLARATELREPAFEQGGVEHPWAHPARQARLVVQSEGARPPRAPCDGRTVGYAAEVHPLVRHRLEVGRPAAVAELDLEAWWAGPAAPTHYTPLPRYPAVYRDFAVVVGESVRAEDVRAAIVDAAPELVRDVRFHSVFRGKGVPEGAKSLAWSVTFRHDERTLGDEEVRELEQAVWSSLAERVGGERRG